MMIKESVFKRIKIYTDLRMVDNKLYADWYTWSYVDKPKLAKGRYEKEEIDIGLLAGGDLERQKTDVLFRLNKEQYIFAKTILKNMEQAGTQSIEPDAFSKAMIQLGHGRLTQSKAFYIREAITKNLHELEDWFVVNGSPVPELSDKLNEMKQNLQSNETRATEIPSNNIKQSIDDEFVPRKEYEDLTKQYAVSQSVALGLRKKLKTKGRPDEMEVRDKAHDCRFKESGKINYTKLGHEFGVSYHTAKKWCKDLLIE